MRIYVGNLPFQSTESDVRDLFSQYGSVSDVKLITDRETGRPRGFGFVEMPDGEGNKAVEELNGREYEGRTLKVNEARLLESRGGGGGRGFRR